MARTIEEHATGAVVYQITDDPLDTSNIYCELPYCSADSRVFVFERKNAQPGPNYNEYVICEFGTWKTEVLGQGLRAPGMSHRGIFYYRHVKEGKCLELRRVDLATGESEVIFEFPEDFEHRGMDTVSPDERYYAYGVTLRLDPEQMFGIELLDLKTGAREVIHTDRDICNPHTQFEPTEGKQIMVQHNRGCKVLPDGTRAVIFGEEGATYLKRWLSHRMILPGLAASRGLEIDLRCSCWSDFASGGQSVSRRISWNSSSHLCWAGSHTVRPICR